jgi:ATP-dependent RNA helicase RhlB
MKFTELKLDKDILKGIEDAGFETLMPVQEETLVHSLKGKDVTVQSQTGTGKTAVFLITIFQHFFDKTTARRKKALIVTPTRELAVQIEKDAKQLGRYLPFTIGCFYGGVGYPQQERLLDKGVDIVIGTPGRLLDFSSKGRLDFKQMGYVVIDEADRMLDMGFYPDIARILGHSLPGKKRQTMLYSATLDAKTRSLARDFMNRPVKIEISPEQVTVDNITQLLYHVSQGEKLNLLLGVFKKELPKNALIFTNTKNAAAQVAKHLEYNGYKCLHISGDLPQGKRLKVMEEFKAGKLPFLVATDVAARGLHIEGLELIINYDLPGDPENYVHRIGRTARAGKSGKAIALACEDYIYNLEPIESFIGMKIPVAFSEDDLFEESKSKGMVFDVKKQTRRTNGGGKRRKKTTHAKTPAPGSRPKGKFKKKAAETPEQKRTQTGKRYKPKDKDRTAKSKPQAKAPPHKRKERKERKTTLEERLEYYRKKYGDDFKAPSEKSTPAVKHPPPPKKSLFKRIKDVIEKRGKG